ncbi:Lysine-specific histone demethylase 1 homolog 3 [Linum grandiflorum]
MGEGDCDLSNFVLVEANLGLQEGLSEGVPIPRAVKMGSDEKKKPGVKKRFKSMMESGLDSDDDEPIGSLLKMKKPRNPKKGKAVAGKVSKAGKVVAKAVEFGGMDDTLASLRKKLKGPKKDIGSVAARSSDGVVEKGVGNKRKRKAKLGENAMKLECAEGSKALGPTDVCFPVKKREGTLGGGTSVHSSDVKLVESQSVSGAQSGSDLHCKPNIGTQILGNEISPIYGSSLDSASEQCRKVKKQMHQDGVIERIKYEKRFDSGVLDFVERAEADPCCSHEVCDDNCSFSEQKGSSNNQTFEDGRQLSRDSILVPAVHVVAYSKSSSMQNTTTCNLAEFNSMSKCTNTLDDKLENAISEPVVNGSGEREILSTVDDNELLNHPSDVSLDRIRAMETVELGSPPVEVKCEKDSLRQYPYTAQPSDSRVADSKFVLVDVQEPFNHSDTLPDGHHIVSVSPKREAAKTTDGSSTRIGETACDVQKSESNLLMSCTENSLDTDVDPHNSIASIQKGSPGLLQNQISHNETKQHCAPGRERHSINEGVDGSSPGSLAAEENASFQDDTASVPDSEIKDGKLSAKQRAVRQAKKRRHEDMAYEGDVDWEVLINGQRFLDDEILDNSRTNRIREKFDSSSVSVSDVENGGAAAVSAGLKSYAAGPVEKIKFKDVLKRKSGLQEYLECRNKILSLWSKDVTRVLPLSECGVTDTPSEAESQGASLIREVYSYLDQSGYINVGIAYEKKKAQPGAKHNYTLCGGKGLGGSPSTSVAEMDDGVSFILGQVKGCQASIEIKDRVRNDGENQESEGELVTSKIRVSNVPKPEDLLYADIQQNITGEPRSSDDVVSAITPQLRDDQKSGQSSQNDIERSHCMPCDSQNKKRILVIGAGPAGLTAARHLQRQGFCVTIIEGRSRIGGRVHTDRSSFSVPVDLGASIITGVEADVATERRPDPSSLICAQLGLELTVLNSDCPLYDIVTGEKVPTDLDEALEAEFNSLLDDMVPLISQKGELALKMSLEDGLEYALMKRRLAQARSDMEGIALQTAADFSCVSTQCSAEEGVPPKSSSEEILTASERRVMDWHFANLEYGCAALLKQVSLSHWNQDDVYGGFGGAHCMIKGGYSNVVESLAEGLIIQLNHVVTEVSYGSIDKGTNDPKVKVSTSNGSEFSGDAVLVTVPLGCLKAESIKFSPSLPQWKQSSIQRLGYGVLNKVVLEFERVFWDDSVDYFGATAEDTDSRGDCFMFWNVRKTVGAPVLIALVVGKAAIDGQSTCSSDHVSHAVKTLRKLFGVDLVPDPVASAVTDWGRDPFSYGAYSYVAIGSSGEDYDILGRPVENCLFFAGEATCKEYPDTVGGAMMSGLREAVRIIDIISTGNDYTAEAEALEAAKRRLELERDEVRDIMKRLEAMELYTVISKSSVALLQEMFFGAKTTAGRLHLAKKLLSLPAETLKSFAGTKKGLSTLNSWILDSMGKDGTQLLRHCVRILVLVSTDLLAVRLSGIGKTVKEKVCVHTSRDIRAIASQLVSVWLEVFRREKASNRLKLSRQATALDSSRRKSVFNLLTGKPPLSSHFNGPENRGGLHLPVPSAASPLLSGTNMKNVNGELVKHEMKASGLKSRSQDSINKAGIEMKEQSKIALSKEEKAALAAAEAAQAAARAAAEAYAKCNTMVHLPKIPSFHKFAKREQYPPMDECDPRKKWSSGVFGGQDCTSEIDSRNCRVRNWSVDFSATCENFSNSRLSIDNLSQRSHSNEIASRMNLGEQSGESAANGSSLYTKAWVDTADVGAVKGYQAIERWQSQAAAADSEFYHPDLHINDEEHSNTSSRPPAWRNDRQANESSVSQVTVNKETLKSHSRSADRIKQAVVDFVASLLMPIYKAHKIDRDGYKSIMKKCATKVMERATDAEKAMSVSEFLDSKRKNKIRAFVDKLMERQVETGPADKP